MRSSINNNHLAGNIMRKIIVIGICGLLLNSGANAQDQTSIFNSLRNVAASAMQKQTDTTRDRNSAATVSAMQSDLPPATGFGAKYSTKQALLDGARNGELAGYAKLGNYGSEESKSLVYAIGLILANDYGTPVPNWAERNRSAGGNRRQGDCMVGFVKEDIHFLFQSVTKMKVNTLTDRPPEFMATPEQGDRETITNSFRSVKDHCYLEALGVKQSYPFSNSLAQLMNEYAKATDDFVLAKREQRKEQYQQAVALRQAQEKQRAEAAQQAEAAHRAQEQRQIDADRQRIEEQERKTKERERTRVAG